MILSNAILDHGAECHAGRRTAIPDRLRRRIRTSGSTTMLVTRNIEILIGLDAHAWEYQMAIAVSNQQ